MADLIEAIPSDRIEVALDGRMYGSAFLPDEKFLQETPECLIPIATRLREQSALLALDSRATKEEIFGAYEKDLKLLERHIADFNRYMWKAVECSVIKKTDASGVQKIWNEIKGEIPPMSKEALLELSFTRAALPVPELARELKDEFQKGVERTLRLLGYWLQMLVEAEYVGLIEWSAPDVCRYHYYRHDASDTVLRSEMTTEESFDEQARFGGRNVTTKEERKTIKRSTFLGRHVHHVVMATEHTLEEYGREMPSQVCEFLDCTPLWLRPLLRIVDGQITMEEIVSTKVSERTFIERRVISVTKYSPTVALGPFSIIGWSGDDLVGEARYSRVQSVGRRERKRELSRGLSWFGIGSVALGAIIWCIVTYNNTRHDERTRQYNAYAAAFTNEMMTTRKGEPLALPDGKVVRYGGLNESYPGGERGQIFVVPEGHTDGLPPRYSLPQGNDGFIYGDIDLAKLGVFVRLHVLYADDEHIRYAVTPYKK